MSLLQGEKVKLRALEPLDIPLLLAVENNTELWFVSESNLPLSKAILENYVENATQDIFEARQFRFVIDLEETPVGLIDVFDFDPVSLKAGVGIVVLPQFRGKGIAKEAIHLLQNTAMQAWQIHQLYAHISEENIPSIRAFESCRFQKVGFLKDWKKWNGKYVNMHVLQWFSEQ
ncbi:MAG: GNAT family N-acetyltransferase [Schleiferiaceae bacterium]|jgi:diamine N-acetyltransferase|nr:GNAT family N-acetyltransferase [Schleiferiaceae bacterium]